MCSGFEPETKIVYLSKNKKAIESITPAKETSGSKKRRALLYRKKNDAELMRAKTIQIPKLEPPVMSMPSA